MVRCFFYSCGIIYLVYLFWQFVKWDTIRMIERFSDEEF